MKTPLSLLLLLVVFFSMGCNATVNYEPLVSHRVWKQDSSDKIFDAAVRVLHSEDFLIASSDKDAGLIATDWKQFRTTTGWQFKIRVNLLVMKETEGHTALSFKTKVQGNNPQVTGGQWINFNANDPVDAAGYQQLTQTLDDFFLEIQRYAGPSVQQR